jgi:hypothetical protein
MRDNCFSKSPGTVGHSHLWRTGFTNVISRRLVAPRVL